MNTIFAGAAALAAVVAVPATAATYAFTFNSTNFSGSGTFVTQDTTTAGPNGDGFLITSIMNGTATANRTSSTMLLAPNAYESNDNLLYLTGSSLDYDGFSFIYGPSAGQMANVYYSNGYSYLATGSGAGSGALASFTVTPTGGAVPEPASWAMLLSGFGLTGAALRRRSSRVAVQAI